MRLGLEPLEPRQLLTVRVWDGADIVANNNSNWSDPANWVGNVAPQPEDNLVFPTNYNSSTTINDDLGANFRLRSITISGSNFNITTSNSSSIQLMEGFTADNASGSNSFGVPLLIAPATTLTTLGETIFNANPNATLYLTNTGNTIIDTGVIQSLTLTIDGAGTTNITGNVNDAGSIVKNGSGTLALAGNNSYEGFTTINQGVVIAESNNALGSSATGTTVNQGAALQVQGSNLVINEPLTLNGNGIGVGAPGAGLPIDGLGALRLLSSTSSPSTATWSGAIQLPASATTPAMIGVEQSGMLTVTGEMTALSTGSFIKMGPGTLQLAGTTTNLILGTTTVDQGTLLLNMQSGALPFEGSLTIGDNIEGPNESVVRLASSDPNQIPATDFYGTTLLTVTMYSSGMLDLNGNNDSIGNLAMVEGASYSANITTGASVGGTLSLLGNVTVTSLEGSSGASPAATIGGVGNLDLSQFFSGAAGAATHTFTVAQSALASINPALNISANITGSTAGSFTKAGPGTIELSGSNSYNGPTFLTAGTVEFTNSTAFGNASSSSAVVSVGTVTLWPINAATISNVLSLDGNPTIYGSSPLTLGGNATLTSNRTITVVSPSETLTMSGVIGESVFGSQGISKAGRGTLALSAVDTYSGSTSLATDGGVLDLTGSGSLLNSQLFSVGQGATLVLDDSTATVAGGNRVNSSYGITLAGGTIKYQGNSSTASSETLGMITLTSSFSSAISSQYDGASAALAIQGFNRTATTGTSVNFVGVNADLSSGGANQINILTSPGGLTNGILPWATVTGPAGLDFATYVGVGTSNSLVNGAAAIMALPASDYVTSLAAAGPTSNVKLTASEAITGDKTINSLLILGAGLNVSNAASNPGVLNVSSGAVAASGGSNSISTGALNLAAESFLTTGANSTLTISSTVLGAASILTKAGTGTLVLTGQNQFSGTTTINQGIVNIQNSGASGAATGAVIVNSGASLELQQGTAGPINIGIKPLTLTGTGFGDIGAIDNISGTNSWAGTITQNAVTVDGPALFAASSTATITTTFYGVAPGSTLSLTNAIAGSSDLVQIGGGTLVFGGDIANTYTGATRVKSGTLVLDKPAGVNAIAGTTSPVFVGDDSSLAANPNPGTLTLLTSNQIADAATIQLGSAGTLNFNSNSDIIGTLVLTTGPNGSSNVTLGTGTLSFTGATPITLQTYDTYGSNNATTATISGGTLALDPLVGNGAVDIGAAVTRTFVVNAAGPSTANPTTGVDLNITSSIVDGEGLGSNSITKVGGGSLEFSGNVGNTYTGTTTITEGTLLLNKLPGVNAFSGPLVIGSNIVVPNAVTQINGGVDSQVVRLIQSEQIPDAAISVAINSTGLLDLNGNNETFGNQAGSTALTLSFGNVSTEAGTLYLDGDLVVSNTITTSVNNGQITGIATVTGNLNLGSGYSNSAANATNWDAPRTLTINHNAALADDLILSANISGSNDINKTGSGVLTLAGNNSNFSGQIFSSTTASTIGIANANALGTGALYLTGTLVVENGVQTISNPVYTSGTVTLAGGNQLILAGPVDLTAATTVAVTNSTFATITGTMGESFGSDALTKSGIGFLEISSTDSASGTVTVNAGTLLVDGAATAINVTVYAATAGGTIQFDNAATSSGAGQNVVGRINPSRQSDARRRRLRLHRCTRGRLDRDHQFDHGHLHCQFSHPDRYPAYAVGHEQCFVSPAHGGQHHQRNYAHFRRRAEYRSRRPGLGGHGQSAHLGHPAHADRRSGLERGWRLHLGWHPAVGRADQRGQRKHVEPDVGGQHRLRHLRRQQQLRNQHWHRPRNLHDDLDCRRLRQRQAFDQRDVDRFGERQRPDAPQQRRRRHAEHRFGHDQQPYAGRRPTHRRERQQSHHGQRQPGFRRYRITGLCDLSVAAPGESAVDRQRPHHQQQRIPQGRRRHPRPVGQQHGTDRHDQRRPGRAGRSQLERPGVAGFERRANSGRRWRQRRDVHSDL